MPFKPNEREYRSLDLKRAEDREDGQKIVEGYATTFNRYLLYDDGTTKVYEQIDRRAFDGADMSDCIMQYDHEGRVLARTSNGTLQLVVDDHGLFVKADLSVSEAAREMYNEIRAGLVNKMSWAFTVEDEDFDRKTSTRTIKKVRKVFDVSGVSRPANDSTEISARTFVDSLKTLESAADRAYQLELRKRMKEKTRNDNT